MSSTHNEEVESVKVKESEFCQLCYKQLRRGYCEDCDDFFLTGHAMNCPSYGTTIAKRHSQWHKTR